LLAGEISPFSARVIEILKGKYDKQEGRMLGKKFI
jgi:hypothetical protein